MRPRQAGGRLAIRGTNLPRMRKIAGTVVAVAFVVADRTGQHRIAGLEPVQN